MSAKEYYDSSHTLFSRTSKEEKRGNGRRERRIRKYPSDCGNEIGEMETGSGGIKQVVVPMLRKMQNK